jgi:hypothetical protein
MKVHRHVERMDAGTPGEQAEAIRRNKLWLKSTAPRTAEGKAIASRNADKGVNRAFWQTWERAAKARAKHLEHLIARDGIKPLGPADQVARDPRSPEATARYETELERLYEDMRRHGSPFDLAMQLLNGSPRERQTPFPDRMMVMILADMAERVSRPAAPARYPASAGRTSVGPWAGE